MAANATNLTAAGGPDAQLLSTLPPIPGVEWLTVIGSGSWSVVARARCRDRIVAVKVARRTGSPQHPAASLTAFRAEAALLARLDDPGVTRPMEVGLAGGRPYCIMEEAPGVSLLQVLAANGTVAEGVALAVATSVARVLSKLHAQGLIHRDIKPANLCVELNSGGPTTASRVMLLDFGLAAEAGRDGDGETAGTLDYMSPEQMGLLNRTVDGRSDLYALGAVLFECVTGRLPREMRQPGPVSRPWGGDLPPVASLVPQLTPRFAEVIDKLLSQDPDARYQSAPGLLHDLTHLATLNTIAARDQEQAVVGGTAFVGREVETARVRGGWQRAKAGGRSLVLLAGAPGVGKSRLLREALQDADASTLSLYGKCSEDVPFAPLRQIFDGLHRTVLASDGPAREELLQRLRAASLGRGAVIEPLARRLVKEIGVGDGRDAAQLTQEAYCAELATFFTVLASPASPLAILVDDIQWIDEPSLKVLEAACKASDVAGLMITMTCRDDAASLAALAAARRRLDGCLDEFIEIGPLDKGQAARLIRGQLGGLETPDVLVDLVHAQTGGSPLAVAEYCRTLFLRGVMAPDWGRWTLDEEALQHLALPRTVEGLIGARIERLAQPTRDLLTRAAIIGHRFDTARCVALHQEIAGAAETSAVQRGFRDAAREHLIERANGDLWEFTHDRVREALIESLSEGQRRDLHQACAAMYGRQAEDDPDALYAAAHHLLRGRPDADAEAAYAIFVRAAMLAADGNAASRAYDFYRAAQELRPDAFARDYIHQEAFGQLCTELHRKDEGIVLLRAAVVAAPTPLDRARILGKLARALVTNLETAAGKIELENAFRELGWSSPKRLWHIAQGLFASLIGLLMTLTGLGRGKAKGAWRSRLEVLCDLHEQSGYVKYFDVDPYVYATVTRAYPFVVLLGESKIYVSWYCNVVFTLGIFGFMGLADRVTAHLRAIAERLGDPRLLSHVMTYRVMGLAYCGRYIEAERECEKLLGEARNHLFTEDFTNLSGVYMASLTMRGLATKTLLCATSGMQHLLELSGGQEHHRMAWFYSYSMTNQAVVGNLAEARTYADKLDRYFAQYNDEPYHRGIHLNNLMLMRLESGDLGDAVERDIDGRHQLGLVIFEPRHPLNHFYILQAQVRLEQYRRQPHAANARRLRQALRRLKWRSRCDLFRSYYWSIVAAQALIAGNGRGQHRRSRRCLERAEHLARRCNNLTVLFECRKTLARLWRASGNPVGAMRAAREAAALANEEGWQLRLDALRKEFGDLGDLESMAARAGSRGSSARRAASAAGFQGVRQWRQEEQLRTLLSVSTAAGASLDAGRQAGDALAETVRLLGADRAAVFLHGDNGLTFFCGRGADDLVLDNIEGFSRSVVDRVWRENAALVVSGTAEGEVDSSASIVAHDLRSIIAAPIAIGQRRLGVLYLDSRFAKGVFGEHDVEVLQAIGTMIGVAAEMARASRLEVEKMEIQKDLEVAGTVQRLLLPPVPDLETAAYRLASFYWAAAQSGGDWWWSFPRPDGGLRVLAGDVTGHGAGAAMVTAVVAGVFQAIGRDAEPERLLRAMHEALIAMTRGQYFMTFTIVDFGADGSQADVWNAGGPGVLTVNPGDRRAKRTLIGSSPLGFEPLEIGHKTLSLGPTACLALCSDGCYEFDVDGRPFGLAQLGELLAKAYVSGADPGRLRDDLRDWLVARLGAAPKDDITLVLVAPKSRA